MVNSKLIIKGKKWCAYTTGKFLWEVYSELNIDVQEVY